jgi:hypothetical protein
MQELFSLERYVDQSSIGEYNADEKARMMATEAKSTQEMGKIDTVIGMSLSIAWC